MKKSHPSTKGFCSSPAAADTDHREDGSVLLLFYYCNNNDVHFR